MNEEFDRCPLGPQENLSHLSKKERMIPDDFSDEELAFVRELNDCFAIDKEDVPPYFVQTLLASEDVRFQPIDPEFEKRICARVFRQLESCHEPEARRQPEPRRPLNRPHQAPVRTSADVLVLSRPFTSSATVGVLCMLLIILIFPLLISGRQSSIVHTSKVPVSHSTPLYALPSLHPQGLKLDMPDTQQQLRFPMSWPQWTPDNYILRNAYLCQGVDQRLADGPALELDYDYSLPGVVPRGTGKITVYEFKPIGRDFQVDTHKITINSEDQSIMTIDGRWMDNRSTKAWTYDGRSELIYEQDGVIFWISGDQRDGVNSDVLLAVASSLQIFDVLHAMHMGNFFGGVIQSTDRAPTLFVNNVVSTSSGPDGPFFSVTDASLPSYTIR